MITYSEQQLQQMPRPELWTVLGEMGLSPRRSKADCIRVILENQPQTELEEYLEEQVCEVISELKKNGKRDKLEGLPMMSVHPAYRLGYKTAEVKVEVAEVNVQELQSVAITTASSGTAKHPSVFSIDSIKAIHQHPGFSNQKCLKPEVDGYVSGLLNRDPASRNMAFHVFYQKGVCDRWLMTCLTRDNANLILTEFGLFDNFFVAKLDNLGNESNWVIDRANDRQILELGTGKFALFKVAQWVSDQLQ